MHLTSSPALLAAVSCTVVVVAAPADLTPRQSTVRIMALGDSITGSPVRNQRLHLRDISDNNKGGWRAYLWQRLQAANIKNTDFVGTLPGQDCGFAYDGENEGHVSSSHARSQHD
jgi:hypothetical protein